MSGPGSLPRIGASVATLDEVLREVRATRSDVDQVASEVHEIGERLARAEQRIATHETSEHRASKRDMEHEAAIGALVVDVGALKSDVASLKETQATQLDILRRLDALAANPMLRRLAWVLGTALLSYLASKGWSVP